MTLARMALLALLTLGVAEADEPECTDISEHLDDAWSAFDDAELAQAETAVLRGVEELACQTRLVTADELLELLELNALVALGNEDEQGAVYAVIRMVTADPQATTDPANGPALAELHATWQRRLSGALQDLRVLGERDLILDGRLVPTGTTLQVVEGEHLIQWSTEDGVHSEVREVVGPSVVATSEVDPSALAAPVSDDVADEETEAMPLPSTAPEPVRRRPKPVGRPAVWGTGLGLALAGGGAITAAFLLERSFGNNAYDAGSYGGCSVGEACYAQAREDAIRRDATLVRALYGTGYGLVGAGGTMFVVGMAVKPKAQGVQVGMTMPLP